MPKAKRRADCETIAGKDVAVLIDEDSRFELYGYEFQIIFGIVMKDGEVACEEARVTSPAWRYDLVHAYRSPDEPVWTDYQPHVHGTMRAHTNPLVATTQVLASIV